MLVINLQKLIYKERMIFVHKHHIQMSCKKIEEHKKTFYLEL